MQRLHPYSGRQGRELILFIGKNKEISFAFNFLTTGWQTDGSLVKDKDIPSRTHGFSLKDKETNLTSLTFLFKELI